MFGVKPRGHFRIERRHHLWQRFDDGNAQSAVALQLLGHFETDVAAANHDRAAGATIFGPIHNALNVGDVADCEMASALNAWNRRFERRSASGQNKCVVALSIFAAVRDVSDADFARGAID